MTEPAPELPIVLRAERFLDTPDNLRSAASFMLHAYGIVENRYLHKFPDGHTIEMDASTLEALKGSKAEVGDLFKCYIVSIVWRDVETDERETSWDYAVSAFKGIDKDFDHL